MRTRPIAGNSQGATQAEGSPDVTFSITLDEAVPQGGASVEFFAYTSVASQYLPTGATAATAGTDFTAIPRPTTTGESSERVQAQQTISSCAASTPSDCKLVIGPGEQEGRLTITGLLLDDDAPEDSKRFTVLFEPTPETRAVFGYSDEPVPAVVTILPSDADRTLRITLPQTTFEASAAANIPPVPLDFTLSKALDNDISMGVILTDTTPDPDRRCTVPVTLKGGVLYQQTTISIASCFGTGDTDLTFPKVGASNIGLNVSLILPKESGESGTGELFAATTAEIKHSFASLELAESTTGTGDDAQRVLAIEYVEFLTNIALSIKQEALTSIIIVAIADGSLARFTVKPTKPQFVEGVDKNISFTASLSKALTEDVTLSYAAGTGSEAVADSDYKLPDPDTVTIAAGDTTATINIPLIKDAEEEEAEAFILSVEQFTGSGAAQIARNDGTTFEAITLIVDATEAQLEAEEDGAMGMGAPVATTEDSATGVALAITLDDALPFVRGASGLIAAEFAVTTSSASANLADGATAATADADYDAITTGAGDTPTIATNKTCAAAAPAASAAACKISIAGGETDGTLTIAGLIIDDDDMEQAEQFAILLTPTEATQTAFNWTADPIVVRVTIGASDIMRTLQVSLGQTSIVVPNQAGLPTIPIDFTVSEALESAISMDVALTQTSTDNPITCYVPASLAAGMTYQQVDLSIAACFGTGDTLFTFPAINRFQKFRVSLRLPKESEAGALFAATTDAVKHKLADTDLVETSSGTGDDLQRVLAINATPTARQDVALLTSADVVSVLLLSVQADASKAFYTLKPTKPQFVEGVDKNVSFTISLSKALTADVEFPYSLDTSSAEADKDFTAIASGASVSIAAGETSATINIPLIKDATAEGPETLNLITSNPTGGGASEISKGGLDIRASAVIVDATAAQLKAQEAKAAGSVAPISADETDDTDITVSLTLDDALPLVRGASGLIAAEFAATTSSASTNLVQGVTAATAGSDYTAITTGAGDTPTIATNKTCAAGSPTASAAACKISIAGGETAGTLTITGIIKDDSDTEGPEQFAILLTPTEATRTAFNWTADPIVGLVTIELNDVTRTMQVTTGQNSIFLADTSATVPALSLDVTLSEALTADISGDVELTIGSGISPKLCALPLRLTAAGGTSQTISLALANCYGTGQPFGALATNTRDAIDITFSLPANVAAANLAASGHGFNGFTFTGTTSGSGASAKRKFRATVDNFRRRVSSSQVAVTVRQASKVTYTLTPTKAKFVEGTDSNLSFVFELSSALTESLDVDYIAFNGTATVGSDFVYDGFSTTLLSLSIGQTRATINVPLTDDSDKEGEEFMFLQIVNLLKSDGNPSAAVDQSPFTGLSDPTVAVGQPYGIVAKGVIAASD